MKMVFRSRDGKISSDELEPLLKALGKKDVTAEAAATVKAAGAQTKMATTSSWMCTSTDRRCQEGFLRIQSEWTWKDQCGGEVMAMLWEVGEGCRQPGRLQENGEAGKGWSTWMNSWLR